MSAVGRNTSLKELRLSRTGLNDSDIVEAARCRSLRQLMCSYNRFGVRGAAAIAANTSLQVVAVTASIKGDDAAASELAKTTTITHLDSDWNALTDISAISFGDNTSITHLGLAYNRIALEGVQALARNPRFIMLDLSHQGTDEGGGPLLADEAAQELARSRSIRDLRVAGNDITAVGAMAIAASGVIEILDISGNLAGDDGAKAFAGSRTLKELDISENEVGVDAARAFARNTTLVELDISLNPIEEAGVHALAGSRSLKKLHAAYWDPDDLPEGVVVVPGHLQPETCERLADNDVLEDLNIAHWTVGDAGAMRIAKTRSIHRLDVTGTGIKKDGALAIAANEGFTDVTIDGNDIGDEAALALANNPSIKVLSLQDCGLSEATREKLHSMRDRFESLTL